MREPLASLEKEPVSVHAPVVSSPGGRYRHEPADERRVALLTALDGVQLGAYDQRILHWLAAWDVPVVAALVSLVWRAHHTAAQAHRGGGESR